MKLQLTRAALNYWAVIIMVALLTGSVATAYAVFNASSDTRSSLLDRSKSIAELVSAEDLEKLDGTVEDTRTDTYNDIKQRLVRIQQSYQDVTYIYIVQINSSGRPYYLVDSANPATSRYAEPGQPYAEGMVRVKDIVDSKDGRILNQDSQTQGAIMSAISPIVQYGNGSSTAILGMDISHEAYFKRIVDQALIPILLTSALIIVVLWAKRRAQLQQQFVSEKAFFLSFASHEIRSPLVSIAWALEYIAKQKNAPPVFLERATTSIHTILDTIEDVMEMQKTEQLSVSVTKRQSVQIHGLIYRIIDSMYLASKEHDVTISDTTTETNKLFVAQVDPRLFERVLATLLYNAIKHSPANGIVEIGLTQSDKDWQIRVHNDGEHISEEDQRHIFVDYSQTTMAKDKRYKGVGFGLLLAYEIITAHGGDLRVESQENEGVTILINMPKKNIGKVIKT